jgi:integrase
MSGLPKGLYKRHRSYYVRHKQDGEWKLTNVGQDLGEALERHVNLRTGREFPKDAITLPLIVERYLKHHELYSKRKTQEYVRLTSARLVRFFRSRPIDSLTEEDLETFIGYRLETVQPISVNADLRVLKAILRLGVQQGLIEQMPFKIRMLKVTKRRTAHIFSPEEIKRLLDAAGPRERALIIICSATGIRLEEALHLQWGDIDWDKRKLSIRAKEGWSPKSHQERSMFVPRTVIT